MWAHLANIGLTDGNFHMTSIGCIVLLITCTIYNPTASQREAACSASMQKSRETQDAATQRIQQTVIK